MIPYANSVIASLQYANTVTAIFPLCQFSTLPFCSMMNLQHDSITIATEQESHIRYLLRFFGCLAHPNLSATLTTDQK